MLHPIRLSRAPFPKNQLRLLLLPPGCRSFHCSPRPQYLDSILTTTHSLFEGLHSATGLPWAYTIPLVALTIRTTLILPLSIYTRRSSQKQRELQPLVQAWQRNLQNEAMAESGHLGPAATQRTLVKKTAAKQREIFKRWGCSTWKVWLPLAQLPVFLVAVETIRRMCGAREGLLGLILRTESGITTANPIPSVPAMAEEGMLWFPNLCIPDPELYLPFILCGVMLVNIGRKQASSSKLQMRLTNGLRVVSLAIPFVMLQMPSAVLLYWISSTSFAYIQQVSLNKFMPLEPPVIPCKPRESVLRKDMKK